MVDYAGLFPPAQLPLEAAVREYAAHLGDAEAWMLGRFIIPAQRLEELEPHLGEFPETLRIAALGQGGRSEDEYLKNIDADLAAIEAFRAAHGDSVAVESFEARLPPLPVSGTFVAAVAERLRGAGLAQFHEFAVDDHLEPTLAALAGASAGAKLRCGGVSAGAFPAPEQVARFIIAARDAGVTTKFTAGLHHPVRHFDDSVGTETHGFLNLYVGGMLAHTAGLNWQELAGIITDQSPDAFALTGVGVEWRGRLVRSEDVARLRENALLGQGSCSFAEPVADLRDMGWL
ncbi:MAG: hypothetical protein BEU05_03285 [Marine Group III euryarchaeote CG-Bathy2]|uniref:Uncharacterized protein n=3 Tax=Methanobacteriati TaxID=3366610 RepID=A0A075GZY0_9EURY|nr:hypothetical protein [uncultured marine group II/III euryarchaeote KM3_164_G07]AIF09506.1 hypothetical protein [uncultured marine group II/III euryarchaeote KM3_37_D11]OIR12242.1 MAG: hypothetical protein BEU05_03285 [Marine Group III euryarchaeote CG-Bathy2]